MANPTSINRQRNNILTDDELITVDGFSFLMSSCERPALKILTREKGFNNNLTQICQPGRLVSVALQDVGSVNISHPRTSQFSVGSLQGTEDWGALEDFLV